MAGLQPISISRRKSPKEVVDPSTLCYCAIMARQTDFAPSIYEHAAALIGKTPLDVSQTSDLLFRAHAEAFRLYGHSPIVVGIDIYNLEAEAYGSIVGTPDGNGIPAICQHALSETGYLLCPFETDQALFMRKMRSYPEIMVRINMDPGGFASGDLASLYRELDRVLELAAHRDKVCIGTGALPFEADPAIVLKAKAFVREKTA